MISCSMWFYVQNNINNVLRLGRHMKWEMMLKTCFRNGNPVWTIRLCQIVSNQNAKSTNVIKKWNELRFFCFLWDRLKKPKCSNSNKHVKHSNWSLVNVKNVYCVTFNPALGIKGPQAIKNKREIWRSLKRVKFSI